MSSTAVAVASVGAMEQVDEMDLAERYGADISAKYTRIYRDVVQIGATLVEARDNLRDSTFKRMVEGLPFSRASAYRYISEYILAEQGDASPVRQLSTGYSVRDQLEKLTPEQIDAGIAAGKLKQGVSRSQVIDYRRELAATHQHRPASNKCPAPSRPEGAGARSYAELVYLLREWRKSVGVSQAALDHDIGGEWGEGQVSKYEIPHTDDGRLFSLFNPAKCCDGTLFDYLAGLGLGIQLVPLA